MTRLLVLSLCLVGALALPSSRAYGTDLFRAPWRAFDVANYPEFAPVGMAIGDVDGDGDPDIAVARAYFGSPGLGILKNNGDGTYAEEELYNLAFGQSLGAVALVDMDRDGDLDAVATVSGNNGQENRIAVWRNNGTGTFGSPQFYAAGSDPTGLVVADFNGDGFPDVLCTNGMGAGTIALLRHNGVSGSGAGFLAPSFTTVGPNAMRVTAGDIDHDGDLDVVVGRSDLILGPNGINVLLNNGSGLFSPSQTFTAVPSANRQSYAVLLVDVDRDGWVDLVTAGATNASTTSGLLAIRRNTGGTFGDPQVISLEPWTFTVYGLDAADVTGDGWPDILATTPSGRAMDGWNLVPSTGDGSFGTAVFRTAAKWTYEIRAADADADGDLDVLTLANDSSVITVHQNENGAFPLPPRYSVGTLLQRLRAGDLDRDGDIDLVSSGGGSSRFILRNNGQGAFSLQSFSLPFTANDIILADMNNDGYLDVVASSAQQPYNFAVALNNGQGSFLPAVVTTVNANQAGEVGAFDVDNDGFRDVILTEPGAAPGGQHIFLFRNLGNGTSFVLARALGGFGPPFGIDGGDLDHDGNVDLVSETSIGLTVFFGNGDFTFSAPMPVGVDGYPFRLADINADSHLDLIYQVPQDSFGTVSVGAMRGFGDGGFDLPFEIDGPNGLEAAFQISSDLDVADVDGDGKPDIVLTNNAPNDVSIFRGNGDGTFQPHERYGAGYAVNQTAVADYNGDGQVDLAVGFSLGPSGLPSAVTVLFGIRPATAVLPSQFTVTRGVLTSGGLTDLFFSDDSYVNVEARRPTEVAAASVEIEVEGTAPSGTASSLTFVLEAASSGAPVRQRIELFNYQSGQWEQVDERNATFADTTVEIPVTSNATRFIQPGTRQMRARIGFHDRGVTFVNWGARYDQVRWLVAN
ncbi:MAG: hypothetical protein KatS3mg015_0301 [Fimbriimonadales bacterium]|nr:MAG: hypothetical protein KatS3mg015_0301 [Fimbriimonadales bacterium]